MTLTLTSAAAILPTDTNVKVTYAKPSNNGLKDAANNEVVSLTDQTVTNNTDAPAGPSDPPDAPGRPACGCRPPR